MILSNVFFRKNYPNYSQDTIDLIRLSRSENVGPRTFHNLIKIYQNARTTLENIAELSLKGGRSKPIKICSESEVLQEIEKLHKIGGSLVTYKQPAFSNLLRQIDDCPPVLSYLGNISMLNDTNIVAIVGARNASINGRSFAGKIANDLIGRGYKTASGLAYGVDTSVHTVNRANTIAVVAGGIDNIYPKENTKLYQSIAEEGLIIAEQPFGAKPLSSYFPMRNRIISGISICVCVIEAGIKSGSLITANFALEHNRDVFSMPGFPLDPRSEGSNKLIKDGAYILESVNDIINNVSRYKENYQTLEESAGNDNSFIQQDRGAIKISNADRKAIIDILSSIPVTIDTIATQTKLSFSIIHMVCLELELAGRALRYPGNKILLVYS